MPAEGVTLSGTIYSNGRTAVRLSLWRSFTQKKAIADIEEVIVNPYRAVADKKKQSPLYFSVSRVPKVQDLSLLQQKEVKTLRQKDGADEMDINCLFTPE